MRQHRFANAWTTMRGICRGATGVAGALALSTALAAGTADASTTTGNLGASTTVIGGNSATITTQPVAFPSYNPVNTAPTDGQGNVGVAATAGLPYTIALGGGLAAAPPQRRLQSGVNMLNYNLYLDSTRTSVWGEGTLGFPGGTRAGSGTGTATTINHPVFGRIPSGQGVPAGSYSDTVVVTVTF